MNDYARRMMSDRARGRGRSGRGGRMGGRPYGRDMSGRGEYRGEYKGEYRSDYRGEDYDDYGYETDGRRGVKGTGPYGIGGRRYYGRRDRAEADYDYDDMDYDDGRYDYADSDSLTKRDYMEWKRRLMNADGTQGEHFHSEDVMRMAEKLGVKYRGYDEKDLCMAMNMLYSDYCEALRNFIPKDQEPMLYLHLAKAFLEDEDAPDGKEKLALYYHCIVEDGE